MDSLDLGTLPSDVPFPLWTFKLYIYDYDDDVYNFLQALTI